MEKEDGSMNHVMRSFQNSTVTWPIQLNLNYILSVICTAVCTFKKCSCLLHNILYNKSDFDTVCFVCLSNLRILQKSAFSTSASGEQWQEKPLCLGSAGSCGSVLVGHILGFGEDELG